MNTGLYLFLGSTFLLAIILLMDNNKRKKCGKPREELVELLYRRGIVLIVTVFISLIILTIVFIDELALLPAFWGVSMAIVFKSYISSCAGPKGIKLVNRFLQWDEITFIKVIKDNYNYQMDTHSYTLEVKVKEKSYYFKVRGKEALDIIDKKINSFYGDLSLSSLENGSE